jgi:hypothetical protein
MSLMAKFVCSVYCTWSFHSPSTSSDRPWEVISRVGTDNCYCTRGTDQAVTTSPKWVYGTHSHFCTDSGCDVQWNKRLKAHLQFLTLTGCYLEFESPSMAQCVLQVHHDQVVDWPAVAVILNVRELIFGL